jgi:hypothetical protein
MGRPLGPGGRRVLCLWKNKSKGRIRHITSKSSTSENIVTINVSPMIDFKFEKN